MDNSKYFKVEKIFARLNRQHRSKASEYRIGDIVEWCAEIETEVINDPIEYIEFNDVQLEVIDGKALLPCNIQRLVDVYQNGMRLFGYHNDGVKLSFSDLTNTSVSNGSIVRINYTGIPLDDNGYPMFLRGHEQALYWGCIVRMYEEDYALQKIHPNTYNDFTIRYESALNASKNNFRHRSRNEIKEYTAVVMNALQFANRLPMQDMM